MKKIMYFVTTLLVLVGCQNLQEAKENAPGNYGTITGKIELPQGPNKISAPEGWQETTTAFTMVWESTDQIYIYNQSGCRLLKDPSIAEGIATFEGDLLSDMSEYKVAYGYNPNEAATAFTVPYIVDNYRPFADGTGRECNFEIDNFGPIIGLQLKGEYVLSKIEVVLFGKDEKTLATYTMVFGDVLTLNATTATKVYFPIQDKKDAVRMCIHFYEKEDSQDVMIMSKSTGNMPEVGKVTTFPELTMNPYNGHGYVDLGLPSGLKWATCNVGATKPEEFGDYFAWGEVSTKDYYDWSTYKYSSDGSGIDMTKYCTIDSLGIVDNKTILDLEDDAAHVNWGGNWRMPTETEQNELRNNCTWTWTDSFNGTGVKGYIVSSKANSNFIFLPFAGFFQDWMLYSGGAIGYYWSSSLHPDGSDLAYDLNISLYDIHSVDDIRYHGRSVRPVCK